MEHIVEYLANGGIALMVGVILGFILGVWTCSRRHPKKS